MHDLGLDLQQIQAWFPHAQEVPYVLIRVRAEHVATWPEAIATAFRRCYITDGAIDSAATERNQPRERIIASKLPDPGAVMAGDFGEILTYLYQGAREHPATALGATKWRLKQDRQAPAPKSDVVHIVVPAWPAACEDDTILCSEVKTKSTDGDSTPIAKAIEDCAKDRTSRLAKTLAWLRDRAITEDLGDLTVAHLERFLNATDHPEARKRFSAVAVVSAELLEQELTAAPEAVHPDYTVIVVAVPELRATYTAVFAAANGAAMAPATAPVAEVQP
jgi:hypothetical protein